MSAGRPTEDNAPSDPSKPGNDTPVGPQSPGSKEDMSPGTKRRRSTQRPKVPPKSPLVKAKSVPPQKSDVSFDAGSVAPPSVPPRINALNTSTQTLPPPRKPPMPMPRIYAELEPSEPTPPTPTKEEVVVEVTTVEGLAKRPNDLPVMARFIDGYYGKTSRFSVSAGDKFQFHFVKQTKVLSVQDQRGVGFAVPLSSASKFGLLYDQSKMPPTAYFKAVSGLLSLNNLPHVICAQKCVQDKHSRVEVDEGEVLVVKGKHKKALQCYSLHTSSDVMLHKHCEGHFTLDPEKARMFPMDIVNHLPNVFPIDARMYMPATETGSIKSKQGRIFTLLGSTIEVSLIGTSVQLESDDLVDIPLDKNLSKLRIEILASDNVPHLYEDAQAIAENFDPSKCIAFRDVGSDAAFDLQSALIKEVRPAEKNFGVELCTSEYVHMQAFRCKAQKEKRPAYATLETAKTPDTTSEDTNQEYSTIDEFLNVSGTAGQSQQPETLQTPRKTEQKQVSLSAPTTPAASNKSMGYKAQKGIRPAYTRTKTPDMTSEDTNQEYSTIDEFLNVRKMAGQSQQLAKPEQKKVSLSAPTAAVPAPFSISMGKHTSTSVEMSSRPGGMTDIPSTQAPPHHSENEYTTISDVCLPNEKTHFVAPQPSTSTALEQEKKSVAETNREFLMTMDVPQVLDLLDAMKLSQYKETFEAEQISGDVLMDSDEELLEKDLGVSKRVHRIRLMKIVKGQHSAKNILEGLSPYSDLSTLR